MFFDANKTFQCKTVVLLDVYTLTPPSCYCQYQKKKTQSHCFGCSVSLNFALELLRVLSAPHGNISTHHIVILNKFSIQADVS